VLKILNVNPEDIVGGVTEVMDSIRAVLFDDRLHGLMRHYEEGGRCAPLPHTLPMVYRIPCCFRGRGGWGLSITFSRGEPPLTSKEISCYFYVYVALNLKVVIFL
jgi:hypothetical protein